MHQGIKSDTCSNKALDMALIKVNLNGSFYSRFFYKAEILKMAAFAIFS